MRFFISLALLLCFGSEGSAGISLKNPVVVVQDKTSLQRGARVYMNYCSGCHSLKYLRYNSMAKGLGLTTFDGQIDSYLLKNNLIFTKATVYDPIQIAMPPEDAKQWFGVVPPDLSLIAREKGAAWIYTYLKSFYVDLNRPFGSNNLLVPDVAMPNVLEPLVGKVALIENKKLHTADLVLLKQGEMTEAEFDSTLSDLVTFLVYVAEPAQLTRHYVGYGVLIFLLLLLVVAYALKKSYWQNIAKMVQKHGGKNQVA